MAQLKKKTDLYKSREKMSVQVKNKKNICLLVSDKFKKGFSHFFCVHLPPPPAPPPPPPPGNKV
ncbi:hypothetical protein BpHYR1_016347 [Brachionus plicatilis]|uniref:Uncharacterized protein n=1 Tax=Brachionus plicatilis TaxID=10195 RepID=A0A3M7P3M3_BRAPC|nr:hypothetical protein BpHYR1_016347 [Brachionus plicatilis]